MDDRHFNGYHFATPIADGGGASSIAAASWYSLWEPQPQGVSGIPAALAAVEEPKRALLWTTLELESTRIASQEELRRMETQAIRITRMLEIATRERDEARHALLLLLLHQASHQQHLTSTFNPEFGQAFSLDEGSDVAVAAVVEEGDQESSNGTSPGSAVAALEVLEATAMKRSLPEKGRLVETVIAAGPLLQTLLLAGPLPQWQHPPPELRSSDIPPVAISSLSKGKSQKAEKDRDATASPTVCCNHSSSSSPEIGHSNCGSGNSSSKQNQKMAYFATC